MRRAALSLIVAAAIGATVPVVAIAQTPAGDPGNSAPDEQETAGTVQLMLPDEVVLATGSGLMHLAVTGETQRPLTFAPGDYVDLWYRTSSNGEPGTIIRVGERAENPNANAVTTAEAPEVGAAGGGTAQASQGPPEETSPSATGPATGVVAAGVGSMPKRLPQTGSKLPLVGLVGLLSLLGGATLRLLRV